jgi:hypothetical protein
MCPVYYIQLILSMIVVYCPMHGSSTSLLMAPLSVAPVYRGTVQVGPFGPYRTVITVLGDEPLVGRRLMERFTVTLVHGDRVIIDP